MYKIEIQYKEGNIGEVFIYSLNHKIYEHMTNIGYV
jgi:hypothetical protein